MRIRTSLARVVLPILLLGGASGCLLVAAGAAGAATYAYLEGDLKAELQGSPQRIVKEAVTVLKDMDIPVESQSATSVDGKVEARTALDKKVTITVKSKSEKASDVWIRVGSFGDEDLSRRICDGIKARL